MQIKQAPHLYDVAIIGSGASGGMTAHVLTQAGLDCVMLEAGRQRRISEFPTHRIRRWDLPYRGLRGDYFSEWLTVTDFLADNKREPYAYSGEYFEWWRTRAVGGKSLFWAGVTPRLGPNEFQPKDDYDTRWPLKYEDVAPFYDRVEEMIGVSSTVQAVGGFPLNKGLKPFAPKPAEVLLTQAAESLKGRGLKVLPVPKAILSEDYKGRPACHYCGPCWQGCDSGSKFDSLRVFINGARRTGKLTLMTDARVRSIGLDTQGQARKVHYWDNHDKTYRDVQAKVVILCAGAIESSHILLNSQIANSSGLVGRYLSEHMYASVGGYAPRLMRRKVVNEDGNGAHIIIPDLTENWRGNKFIRGYQIFPSGATPETTMVGKQLPGFGQKWKQSVRDYYTAGVSVLFQGEVIPNRDNRIEIDPELKDDAGIPSARFFFKYGDNERAMFADMMEVGNEILHAVGAEFTPGRKDGRPSENGHSIHYVGTTRMGTNPKLSVTNPYNQSHDVPNLFIHDAAPFVTAGNQNPTLTILALALRSSERIVDLMKKGDL